MRKIKTFYCEQADVEHNINAWIDYTKHKIIQIVIADNYASGKVVTVLYEEAEKRYFNGLL